MIALKSTIGPSVGLVLVLTCTSLFGQDLNQIVQKNQADTKETVQSKYGVTKETQEPKIILSSFFIFYKKHVSSQDGSNCMFYPSCSHYAYQAVKKKGIIKGTLSAMDRLTRCNGLPTDHYKIDSERMKLIDLVDER